MGVPLVGDHLEGVRSLTILAGQSLHFTHLSSNRERATSRADGVFVNGGEPPFTVFNVISPGWPASGGKWACMHSRLNFEMRNRIRRAHHSPRRWQQSRSALSPALSPPASSAQMPPSTFILGAACDCTITDSSRGIVLSTWSSSARDCIWL